MDDSRQEMINTIMDLVQYLEPRLKGMHPDELKTEIESTHRIDLTEDDEDKLDILMARLVHQKKTRPTPKSQVMGPVAPVRGTPPPISVNAVTLTDFQVNDRVKHLNCPDWGEGDIV